MSKRTFLVSAAFLVLCFLVYATVGEVIRITAERSIARMNPHEVIKGGSIETVECAFLVVGLDPNTLDSNGETPLFAAVYRDVRVVDALIKAGASVGIKNKDGLTALDFARRIGAPLEVISKLADKK